MVVSGIFHSQASQFRKLRLILACFIIVGFTSLVLLHFHLERSRGIGFFNPRSHYDFAPLLNSTGGALKESAYQFQDTKPAWLAAPPSDAHHAKPLVIRMGIISQPHEFDKRKAFRQYLLTHLPTSEVVVDYRFFVGFSETDIDRLVLEERQIFQDIRFLDMHDNAKRMGEKRWRILMWAAEAHGQSYDYFLGADTDIFVRLSALSRRLRTLRPNITNPREQSILWGRMFTEKQHYIPHPYDDPSSMETHDAKYPIDHPGPQGTSPSTYRYPIGFGYLLSSALVSRLTQPSVLLPHHVHYPYDDVLIGSWIADFAPDTEVVDDVAGFHEPFGHTKDKRVIGPVTYDTVVAHHVSVAEIRGMRYKPEWSDEWVE